MTNRYQWTDRDRRATPHRSEGFKHITVWSHRESAGMDGIPPRVVSW